MTPAERGDAAKKLSRPVTLRTVATHAGVSIGTASDALSGHGRVSLQTQTRVAEAAQELGYVANDIARALRTRRTATIGMIVPDITNPFFAGLIRDVEDACRSSELAVLFGNSGGDSERELEYVTQFLERRVDGILLVSAHDNPDVDILLPKGFAAVAVDRIPKSWPRDLVSVNNRSGSHLAVQHLVDLGHTRIGYIGGGSDLDTEHSRLQGFVAKAASLDVKIAAISEGEFTLDSGVKQWEDMLKMPGAPPSAIVAGNDLLALGVIAAVHRGGMRVPDDISVVGFDDSALAEVIRPALTTVRQPVRELARAAVDAIRQRSEDPDGARVIRILEPSLVIRGSSARQASS